MTLSLVQEPAGAAPNPFAAMRTRASTAAALSAAATAVNNVTYLPILEDGDVTICIFQLGQGGRIPLHNHPGMTVFSRWVRAAAALMARTQLQQPGCASHMKICLNLGVCVTQWCIIAWSSMTG